MKLKINGEYAEVGFWSFLKCHLFAYLTMLCVILLGFWAIGVFA